jgi:hypothetical protein
MKYLVFSLAAFMSYFMMFFLPVLLVVFLARWVQSFKPADCANYLNTEYGTDYTAAEIDDAYRRALIEKQLDAIVESVLNAH